MSPKIRFMTKKEEVMYPAVRGYLDKPIKPSVIGIKRSPDPEEMGFEVAHELGHLKHPIDVFEFKKEERRYKTLKARLRQIDRESERLAAVTTLSELCANYYTLTVRPNDIMAIEHLKSVIEYAGLHMNPEQIRRIDKVARFRTGYKGPEIIIKERK